MYMISGVSVEPSLCSGFYIEPIGLQNYIETIVTESNYCILKAYMNCYHRPDSPG